MWQRQVLNIIKPLNHHKAFLLPSGSLLQSQYLQHRKMIQLVTMTTQIMAAKNVSKNWLVRVQTLALIQSGTSAGLGKSSLKHSKELPNHFIQSKTSASTTPKVVVPANTSCCIATSGTKTAGSVLSQRWDFVINWDLFPRLHLGWNSLMFLLMCSPHFLETCHCFNLLYPVMWQSFSISTWFVKDNFKLISNPSRFYFVF